MSKIIRTTISKKDGEYIVRAYGEAGRMPEADYFTNDKGDAEKTAGRMTATGCLCAPAKRSIAARSTATTSAPERKGIRGRTWPAERSSIISPNGRT